MAFEVIFNFFVSHLSWRSPNAVDATAYQNHISVFGSYVSKNPFKILSYFEQLKNLFFDRFSLSNYFR